MNNRIESAHIEVTSTCNLRCKYCYNANRLGAGNEDLSLRELKTLVDELVSFGCSTLVFSGGEPFNWKDFVPFIGWLDECHHSLRYRILTNGTLIDPAIAMQISSIKEVPEMRVSIDGFSHDIMRGKGSYNRALRGATLLVEAGLKVGINTVLTERNYKDCVSFYNFLRSIGVDSWRIDTPFYCGAFVHNQRELGINDSNTLFEIYKDLIILSREHYKDFRFAISRIWDTDVLQGRQFNTHLLTDHPCDYHRHALTFRANGDVSFCPSWNRTFGNIHNEDINSIWQRIQSSEFGGLRVQDLTLCRECKYVRFCGGGCRSDALYAGGTLRDPDLRTCNEMKWLFETLVDKLPSDVQTIYHRAILNEEKVPKIYVVV